MILLLLCAVALTGCSGPELNQQEIIEMLTKHDRGLLVGVELGDTWKDVEARTPKKMKLNHLGKNKQWRYAVGDKAHKNGMYVTFDVEQGKVVSLSASINGNEKNAVIVRKLFDQVIAHFKAKLGDGDCDKGNCLWQKPAAGGGKTIVKGAGHKFKDPLAYAFEVKIKQAAKTK